MSTSLTKKTLRKRCHIVAYSAVVIFCLTISSYASAQVNQSTAEGMITEGMQLLRSGQAMQAKERFDAAIKVSPRSADALTWRGISENQLEQYKAAELDFEAALKLSPSILAAHYNLALSFIRLKKVDAAIKQLRIVVASQANSGQARYNLAILLEGKGLWKEATVELSAAHTMNAADKGVTLHLLEDELRLKDFTRLGSLSYNLALPSTPPEMQRDAATALIEAGRSSDAITILASLHARLPEDHSASSLLARGYIAAQKNIDAISLLESLPPALRDEDDLYLLGLAYEGNNDLTRAAAEFEKAAQLDPGDARPLYHLGVLLAASAESRDKATEVLRSAHKLDPENSKYALPLARLLLVEDHADEASELLTSIPAAGEDAAQIAVLSGVALAATHKINEAITALKKAIDLNRSLSLAYNVLGFCFFQQGRYAEAAAAYGEASNLEPKRQLYARDATLAYERANQPAQALGFAERANALGQADASDHLMLGKLYASTHRNQDAVRELLKAAALNPDLDSADYLLARTYMQMGDKQQAAVWSERLTALKQKREAEAVGAAKSPSVHSSTLLTGGSLASDDAGAP